MRVAGRSLLIVAALCFCTSGCDSGLRPTTYQDGVELVALDWSTNPCDDFYQFACGNWKYWSDIPPNGATISREERTQAGLIDLEYRLVSEDSAGIAHDDDPDADKIHDYYRTCNEALNADVDFATELGDQLDIVRSLDRGATLASVLGQLRAQGVGALIGVSVSPNPDAPNTNQLMVTSGLLSMNRAYFVDAENESYRTAYRDHVDALIRIFQRTVPLPYSPSGDLVLRIETALAQVEPTPAEGRDPTITHHPAKMSELTAATPGFDWEEFLGAAHVTDVPALDIQWPPSLDAFSLLLATSAPADIKAYLVWRVVESAASAFGSSAQAAEFEFHSRLFGGQQTDFPPYWRCFGNTRNALGFSLSRPFVAQLMRDGRLDGAPGVLDAIRRAMAANLDAVPWLDDATRAEAQRKLTAIVAKVGFPDDWSPYDGFKTSSSGTFFGNVVSRRKWAWSRSVADLGAPVDRTRWSAAPIVDNAYYSALFNDITFPAAILQLPFFDSTRPAAANFGSIGSLMGHELTHGFDDSGRQYDATGALRDWWSTSVAAGFDERAACVADQFSGYRPVSGAMVNGAQTLGETIADLGGLKLALAAFHAPDGGNGDGSPGYFTPDQQFFLAFAQGWCENARPDYLRWLVTSDAHPPWHERINGAVRNTPAFAKAFACSTGATLAPAVRCEVW